MQISIIGYGNQARVWAQNLKDSGVESLILLRAKSKSCLKVKKDGLKFSEIKDGLKNKESNIFCMLIPDNEHKPFFEQYLDIIKENDIFIFAHGYSVVYDDLISILSKKNIKPVLLAPKAISTAVRNNYLNNKSTLTAFNSDYVIKNENNIRELAQNLKFAPLIQASFKQETLSDLFTEQTLLCGGVPFLILESFNLLVKNGIPKEIAVAECFNELKYILDLIAKEGMGGMFDKISPVALVGAGKMFEILSSDNKKKLTETLKLVINEIKTGEFVEQSKKTNLTKIRTKLKKLSKDFDKTNGGVKNV